MPFSLLTMTSWRDFPPVFERKYAEGRKKEIIMQLNQRYLNMFLISLSWFWALIQISFNVFSYVMCSWAITLLVLFLQAISCTRSSINSHIDSSLKSQFPSLGNIWSPRKMQKDHTGQVFTQCKLSLVQWTPDDLWYCGACVCRCCTSSGERSRSYHSELQITM